MSVESINQQPAAELGNLTVEDLIKNPSPLALGRIATCDHDFMPKMDYYEVPENNRMQRFLYEQSIGYFDEVVAALHAPDETYRAFMTAAASERPEVLIKHPSIATVIDDPETVREICREAATDDWLLYFDFDKLAAVAPSEDIGEYADRLLARYSHPGANALFAALCNTNAYTPQEKRSILLDNLRNNQLLWQSIKFRNIANQSSPEDNDYTNRAKTLVTNLAKLTVQGVVTTEDICKDLDYRQETGMYALHGKVGRASQIKGEAKQAKLWLAMCKFAGDVQVDSIAADLCDDLQKYRDTRYPDHINIYAYLSYHFPQLADTLTAIMQEYDAEHQSTTAVDFQRHLDALSEGKRATLHEDNANKAIFTQEQLQTHLEYFEQHPENETFDHKAMKLHLIVHVQGDNAELARQIVEKAATQRKNSLMWSFAALERLFAGHDERFAAVLSHAWDDPSCRVPYENIGKFQELTGVSAEDIRARIVDDLKGPYMSRLFGSIKQILAADRQVFTPAECAQFVIERLRLNDPIKHYELELFKEVCYGYFGRGLTADMLSQLPDDSPYKEVMVDTGLENFWADMKSGEYHDLFDATTSLRLVAHRLTPRQITESIDIMLDMLSVEHLVDTLWLTWSMMNDKQQRFIMDRLLANPPLAIIGLQGGRLERRLQHSLHKNILESHPHEDRLQALAPKAHATMKRRLRAKSLNNEVVIDRRNASQLVPTSLQASTNNILMHYAYYYDLCDRVRDCTGTAEVMPKLRGKSTEKNELSALETMVLFRELTGLSDMTALSDTTPQLRNEVLFTCLSIKLGLSPTQSAAAYAQLSAEGIDMTKFTMWVHTAARSRKLAGYFGQMLSYLGEGHTMTDWKFDTSLGNNLAGIPQAIQDKWRQEHSQTMKFAGKPMNIHFTHKLDAIYLAGSQPINNCLHYAYGTIQQGAAGLLTADAKVLRIANAKGSTIGHAIMRLATDGDEVTVVLEPLYAGGMDSFWRKELHIAAIAAAEQYAKSLGLGFSILQGSSAKETTEAAYALWVETGDVSRHTTRSGKTLLMPTTAPYSYADAVGITKTNGQAYQNVLRHKQ